MDQIQTTVAVLFLDMRDCRNQIADFAVTFVVEHLQTNETATRRHAANGVEHNFMSLDRGRVPFCVTLDRSSDGTHFLRLGAISQLFSCDDSRHVCAMSKTID